jgi:hypothetical protein
MADLFGKMMARALNREAPPGHRPAFITGREAGVLRSLGGGVGPHGGQITRGGIPSFERWGEDDPDSDWGYEPVPSREETMQEWRDVQEERPPEEERVIWEEEEEEEPESLANLGALAAIESAREETKRRADADYYSNLRDRDRGLYGDVPGAYQPFRPGELAQDKYSRGEWLAAQNNRPPVQYDPDDYAVGAPLVEPTPRVGEDPGILARSRESLGNLLSGLSPLNLVPAYNIAKALGGILGGRKPPEVASAQREARRIGDAALQKYRESVAAGAPDRSIMTDALRAIEGLDATWEGGGELERIHYPDDPDYPLTLSELGKREWDAFDQVSPKFRREVSGWSGGQQRRHLGTEVDEEGRPFSGARTPDDREAERQEELAQAILDAEADDDAVVTTDPDPDPDPDVDPDAHIPAGLTDWQREQLFPDATPRDVVDPYAGVEFAEVTPEGFTPPRTYIPDYGSPDIFYNPVTGAYYKPPGQGYTVPAGSPWRRLSFEEAEALKPDVQDIGIFPYPGATVV